MPKVKFDHITCDDDGNNEAVFTIHADVYPGNPAILYGPPENCCPAYPPSADITAIVGPDGAEVPADQWKAKGLDELEGEAIDEASKQAEQAYHDKAESEYERRAGK